jgi:putative membrane protein
MTADPKDVLAAERTLLAWIRTGIALMGFGFVVARFGLFLRELARVGGHAVNQRVDGAALGMLVVGAGVVVNVWASLRHRRIVRQLHEGGTGIGVAGPMALGVATGVGGLILVGALVSSVLR